MAQTAPDIQALQERITQASVFVDDLEREIARTITGQRRMVSRLITGLLCNGHVLLEGVPGLAKTLAIRSLAQAVDARFSRIQFTPDLLPADVVGTMVYNPQTQQFVVRKGPVFAHFVLADEINRAPAKVQSALLEAMQERQVTIGDQTYPLEEPFLVLATQNPLDQEGTYPLPEAQLDRFMLRHRLTYPAPADEAEVVRRSLALRLKRQGDGAIPMSAFDAIGDGRRTGVKDLTEAMAAVQHVHVSDVLVRDCVELVNLTRGHPEIELGCSPRAAIGLVHASRARAYIHGRDYAIPEDLFALAEDVMLHRMRLTYRALAAGRTSSAVLRELLANLA
jgi:MoxR-like ATPase